MHVNLTRNAEHHLPNIRYWLPAVAVDAFHVSRARAKAFAKRDILSKNEKLSNKYDGTVFVLGNGPSLRNLDFGRIGRLPVITMNHFERHPARNDLNLVAHCIGEPYGTPTWEDPSPMLEVPAPLFLFNISAWPYFANLDRKDIFYYAATIPASWPFYSEIDLQCPSMNYQSTSQMAIALALYMGFTKIYLAGLDHDWLVTRGSSPHFYEEDGLPSADLAAFSYSEMIEISRNLFIGYSRLRQLAFSHGCQIYNLSDPTYLDVFPNVSQDQ